MKAIRSALSVFAVVSGYALLILSVFTVMEIVGRKLFNFSFQGADELGGYVLAVTGAFGFAYALIERAHTRIDLVLGRIGTTAASAFNVLAALAIAAFALFMAWRGWATLSTTLRYDSLASTPWQTPLWIPQSLWLAGLLCFAGVAALLAVRGVIAFLRSPATPHGEISIPALEDLIEEEKASLGSTQDRGERA